MLYGCHFQSANLHKDIEVLLVCLSSSSPSRSPKQQPFRKCAQVSIAKSILQLQVWFLHAQGSSVSITESLTLLGTLAMFLLYSTLLLFKIVYICMIKPCNLTPHASLQCELLRLTLYR